MSSNGNSLLNKNPIWGTKAVSSGVFAEQVAPEAVIDDTTENSEPFLIGKAEPLEVGG